MRAKFRVLIIFAGALLAGGNATPGFAAQPAWPNGPTSDSPPGAVDHPLVSRYRGSYIVGYSVAEYDEIELPIGRIDGSRDGSRATPARALRLAGKITRISYQVQPERTTVDVMTNLRADLVKRGWTPLFECVGAEQKYTPGTCGDVFRNEIAERLARKMRHFNHSNAFDGADLETVRYASGVITKGNAKTHVTLLVGVATPDRPTMVLVHVVEPRALDTNQVDAPVTSAGIASSIAAEGKVAIYGVQFDTDKADIKPASAATLEAMGQYLRANPSVRVFVVGHTDNQGTLARNVQLSQQRAEAVVAALRATFGIDAARMIPKGVAQFAPLATNDTAEGRAANRRVELVKQ